MEVHRVCKIYRPSDPGRIVHHADSLIASSTTKVAKRKVSTEFLEADQGSRNGSEDLTKVGGSSGGATPKRDLLADITYRTGH